VNSIELKHQTLQVVQLVDISKLINMHCRFVLSGKCGVFEVL